jgi:hypothetical protein
MNHLDPVKRAEAELDALIKEVEAAASSETENTDKSAPGQDETPQAPATELKTVTPAPEQNSQHDELAKANQRYEILQGKYNAEVPRLSAQIADLKRQIASQAAKPAVSENIDPDPEYKSPYVTDAMRESRSYRKMLKEFGQDYAETQFESAAVAGQAVAQAEIKPLAEQTAMNDRDRLHGAIDQLAPNWQTTNDNPAFVTWAQETVEPYSGLPLIDLLRDAYAAHNAARVAKIFNDYATISTAKPDTTTQPNVDALISPTKRGSSSQANADQHQGKVWTEAEIERFFDDHARGRYDNRRKEAADLEMEINRAYKEGRVR